MTIIRLQTYIDASPELCFDLARSIELHLVSTEHTGETVLHGREKGLMEAGETITWKGKHLGFVQTHTSIISGFSYPTFFFEDSMVKGTFKSLRHEHWFNPSGKGTMMTDVLNFESPLGVLGKLANLIFLKRYMRNFIQKRNVIIKEYAETNLGTELMMNYN